MGSNLPSQRTEDKPQINLRPSETEGERVGDSLSPPRKSSSSASNNTRRDPADKQNGSQSTRRTLRFRTSSERPLLDVIERDEWNERLIAILNELRGRKTLGNSGLEERHDNG